MLLFLLVLAHDAPQEVFKVWHGGRGLGGCRGLISDRGLISGGCSGLGATQAAVEVHLRVAVGVGQDDAIIAGLWGLNGRGSCSKLAAVWVEGMAERLGWSLDVGLGRGAILQGGAVFVVVHVAVVAILGLAFDAELVADLVN